MDDFYQIHEGAAGSGGWAVSRQRGVEALRKSLEADQGLMTMVTIRRDVYAPSPLARFTGSPWGKELIPVALPWAAKAALRDRIAKAQREGDPMVGAHAAVEFDAGTLREGTFLHLLGGTVTEVTEEPLMKSDAATEIVRRAHERALEEGTITRKEAGDALARLAARIRKSKGEVA